MITVHHLENSRSQRILWLLEELGVQYEIKRYGRDKETSLAPPELREIHPLGKAPIITDGDVTVAESGAIVEYLVYEYDDGRMRPGFPAEPTQTARMNPVVLVDGAAEHDLGRPVAIEVDNLR